MLLTLQFFTYHVRLSFSISLHKTLQKVPFNGTFSHVCPVPCLPKPCISLPPLIKSLEACLARPNPSRWLIRTVRLSYMIQFTRPRFSSIIFTHKADIDDPVPRLEISVLLEKDPIHPVPPAENRTNNKKAVDCNQSQTFNF